MALSNDTGGGLLPVSNYYIPPTPPPRYDRERSYGHLARGEERRRREEGANSSLALAMKDIVALPLDKEGVKHRKRRGRSVKCRELEEGAEESSQQQVEQVEVRRGGKAMLPCRAPRPDSVDGLEWRRTDLEQYVYLYKDGEADPTEQHQAYRGRCKLMDGTATLVLQNVTSADEGTYECRFVKQGLSVSKRSIIGGDPVSVVRLRVTQSGECSGAEGEEDEEEDNEGEEDEDNDVEEEEERHPPVVNEGHHYVTFGLLGVIGLVAGIYVLVVL